MTFEHTHPKENTHWAYSHGTKGFCHRCGNEGRWLKVFGDGSGTLGTEGFSQRQGWKFQCRRCYHTDWINWDSNPRLDKTGRPLGPRPPKKTKARKPAMQGEVLF